MKRICFIIDSLSGGGAERVVLNLSNAIFALGNSVDLIILENKVSYDISSIKATIHPLTEDRILSGHSSWNKVLLARKLREKVDELEFNNGKFHLVVSNLEDSDKTSSMAKLDNLFHCYHISMQQFLRDKIKHKKAYKRFFRRLKFNTKHKLLYNNKNLIAVSRGVMEDILEFGIKPKSIRYIYNPFDIEEIRRKSEIDCKKIPNEKYIINVSRFSTQKRHDILIKAFVESKIPHKLVLSGTTDKKADIDTLERLKELIKNYDIEDRVIFTGFVKNPYPLIRNADLFVLSSDLEGLPTVLIESLILGTKAVSTNCPSGPEEILTGIFSKYLSPVGDYKSLSNNIKLALDSKERIPDSMVEKFRALNSAREYLKLASNDLK